MYLSTISEKCHRTTLWNAELVHVIKIISFPQEMDDFENNRELCWKNLNFIDAISYYRLHW